MGDLAESTGGFLLANRNDLQPGMERVAGDLQGYYEVAYAPPPAPTTAASGRSRSRWPARECGAGPQRLLRAASGRRCALPRRAAPGQRSRGQDPTSRFRVAGAGPPVRQGPEGREQVLAFEVPLAKVVPDPGQEEGDLRGAAHGPGPGQGRRGPDPRALPRRLPPAGAGGNTRRHPARSAALLRRAYRVGRRTLRGRGGGARPHERQDQRLEEPRLEVPPANCRLRSLEPTVVRRIEPADASNPEATPCRWRASAWSRTSTAPRHRGHQRPGGPALRVYGRPQGPPPQLTLEFVRDGAVVARATPDLPPRGEGRAAGVRGHVPGRVFKPGPYEVRVTARRGEVVLQEKARFTLLAGS